MNAWDMRQDCEAIASFKPSLPTGSTERSRIVFKTNRTCFFWWAGKSLFLGNPHFTDILENIFHRCGGISAAGYLLPVPAWVGNYLKILFLVVSHTYLFIWRTRRTSRSNFWNHGIADWSASGSRMLQCLPKDCSTSHIIYLFFHQSVC